MSKSKQRAQELMKKGKPEKAAEILEKVCKKKPDGENAAILAFIYGDLKLFDKSELYFRESLRLESSASFTHKVHSSLASLLVAKAHYAEAIIHYKKALKLNPQQANIHFELADVFVVERCLDDAIESYQQSLKIKPDQYKAYRSIAQLYESKNMPDISSEHLDKSLALMPDDIESNYLQAKLDSRAKKFELAENRLVNLLEKNMPSHHRSIVLLELGMVLDKMGKYTNAFTYILDANKRMEAMYRPHKLEQGLIEYREEVSSYANYFTSGGADNNSAAVSTGNKLKIIFLVGFPRSGTTLTEQILESHPDIMATHELPVLPRIAKNIASIIGRSFDYPKDISSLDEGEVKLLRDKYLVDMEQGLHHVIDHNKYLLDKLPLNIVHLGLISRLFPEAKILIALRDPRDVCLSCFMQNFTLNQSMRQFLDIHDTTKYYSVVMNLYLHYKKVLNIELLETRYEDIVKDLEASAKRILSYVGVGWDESVLSFDLSAKTRQVHTPSYQGVTQPIYKGAIGKWRNYEKQLSPCLADVYPFLVEFGYFNK